MKLQGSCKTGKQCIAHMKVKEDMTTGKIEVHYCSSHSGHDKQLCHLPIPESTRSSISVKLQQGVPVDKILDEVRDLTSRESIGRDQLIQRQDILNIQKELNLQSIPKHGNDLISTCAWVTELQQQQYNPVLLFKPQGEHQGEDMNDIGKDDFILVIQTQFQKDAMMQYGMKAIMMDSTHGTTQYDFLLISILVIDEYGEGIPVAWAISNREDTAMLMQFLKAVRQRVGNIETNYFMSDCAEQYFNAWSATFKAEKTSKLLCMWHIDRAWRKALNTHVQSTQERVEIYHQLRVLLEEREKSKFMVMLQQFMSFLNDNNERFYEYFNNQYVQKTKEWATWNRIGTIVNTNMFVESFHRLLKVVYLNKKQNRRVDYLLHTLFRITRNLVYVQLRKVEIGKLTHRKCEINKRHKSALDHYQKSHAVITMADEGIWKVQSLTTRGKSYTIESLNAVCTCGLQCSTCNVCVHMYTCTCIDGTLHCTVCKHIHLLCIFNAANKDCNVPAAQNDKDIHEIHTTRDKNQSCSTSTSSNFNTPEYFASMLKPDDQHVNDTSYAKQEVNNLSQQVQQLADQCQDIETLKTVQAHLKSARSILQAKRQHPSPFEASPSTKKIAPNQKQNKQLRFFSTKKNTQRKSQVIGKPNNVDQIKARERMTNTDTVVCGICWEENDKYENVTVEWIQCDTCNLWTHKTCANFNPSPENEIYICINCHDE